MNGADPPHAVIAPPAMLAEGTPARVLAALPGARAVGGCVRDVLAGRPVHDVDIAAAFPPEEIARRLSAAGLKVFETGLAHGTVTAVLDHQPVEVTALRRDVSTDGRHAEVAWTSDWREDAARRDFTINAMSLSADGRLWDYFGGREDLTAGRLRFVGDAATRLREDYLRALRFFRFWARYGRGAPDAAAMDAIRGAVEGLRSRIAPERIWMELKRLLEAPDPVEALTLMEEVGLLAAVLPEGAEPARLHRVDLAAACEPVLRLAILLPAGADTDALSRRLRLSNEERERLVVLRRTAGAPRPGDAARRYPFRAWRARVRAASRCVAPAEPLFIAQADSGGEGWDALRAILAEGVDPVFPLQGRDLAGLVPPGPEMGRRLQELRALWLEQDCRPSKEELLAELRHRLEGDAAQEKGAARGDAAPRGSAGT